MTSFKNNLKTLFSTRQVLQLQVQLNKLFVKSFNQELGWKSVALWQWCSKTNFLDNVFKNKLSTYLSNNVILATQNGKLETCIIYQTGTWDIDFLKNLDISTSNNRVVPRRHFNSSLPSSRISFNNSFSIHSLFAIKCLPKLRIDSTHFKENKPRHNYQHFISLVVMALNQIITITNCINLKNQRKTFDDKINDIEKIFLVENEEIIMKARS